MYETHTSKNIVKNVSQLKKKKLISIIKCILQNAVVEKYEQFILTNPIRFYCSSRHILLNLVPCDLCTCVLRPQLPNCFVCNRISLVAVIFNYTNVKNTL